MIDFMARLGGIFAALSAAEVAAAGKCEYAQVEADLTRLEAAVKSAKDADDAEAASFWSKLLGTVLHVFDLEAERTRFEKQSLAMKNDATVALERIKATCKRHIGIHAPVPAQLIRDQESWIKNGMQVRSGLMKCRELRDVARWTDSANTPYKAAVDVQIIALTELEGVMASTAQSCAAGATLNRAIFFVVSKAIRHAAGIIETAPGSAGLTYYRRTGRAIEVLGSLTFEIEGARGGEVAGGSANALSREIRHTVTMPNLLRVGTWPSGTNGADTAPAMTEKGVTSDGSDGDLGIDSTADGSGDGVKR